MEAFILAAGLGSRLRPITNSRPKALVDIDGRSLLEINIEHLIKAGASRIVVNVHHFSQQIKDFISSKSWDSEIYISDESELLLDTGGGLKKAAPLFSGKEPILIHNVDILSHIDLRALLSHHIENKHLATLAASARTTSRYLLFDRADRLIGWENTKTGEILWTDKPCIEPERLAFSGIAVIEPQMLNLLPSPRIPYSIIPEYLRLAKDHAISSFRHDAKEWIDVGKPETLPFASQFLPLD